MYVVETLTRIGIINKRPRDLRISLVETILESHVPQMMKDSLNDNLFAYPGKRDVVVALPRMESPAAEKLIVSEADRICDHMFDLLGSGPTPLGEKIDWHADFVSGHRWNTSIYYKRIGPAPYPGGYDINIP